MTYDIYDRPNLVWPLLIEGLLNGVRKAWDHPLTQMLWLEASPKSLPDPWATMSKKVKMK